jgi:tetratricopeptide (TPR) repeat protein
MDKNIAVMNENRRKIVLKKDWLLQEIFPSLKENNSFNKNSEIRKVLLEEYATPPILPEIFINGDTIDVQIKDKKIKDQEKLYQRIVKNADEGNFAKAKKNLLQIITQGTTCSDFFRIYGQILSVEHNQKEAINQLKIALKWDPDNTHALAMLGNIYIRYLNEPHKAKKLYKKVLIISPNQYWTLNNLGNCHVQLGNFIMAVDCFDKAIHINPNCSAAYYNKAQAFLQKKSYLKSFDCALASSNFSINDKQESKYVHRLLVKISEIYLSSVNQRSLYKEFHEELEVMLGRKITFKENKNIGLTARVEVAEHKNLNSHIIHFNPSNPDYSYQIMHELMHLYLINDARKKGNNKFCRSSGDHLKKFLNRCKSVQRKHYKKLFKVGMSPYKLVELWKSLFQTICIQTYNTPIDLFIEQTLFDEYPDFRPIQFHGLFRLMEELISSAVNKTLNKFMPPFTRKANIIFIYTQLFQFRDLYGIDLTNMINLSKSKQRAEELYKEYLQIKDNRRPGDEYKLVEKWAKDLYLNNFFDLIPERDIQKDSRD